MATPGNDNVATTTRFNNAAQRRPRLKVLTTSPEVNIAIVNRVRHSQAETGFPAERASPEVEDKVQKMLAEFRAEVPKAIPEARWMAEDTKVYVVPGDASVNMSSFTEISKDGQHAKNAIVITQGALDQLGTAPFKALLGHEFAHHLFAMDPTLLNNPRYMPKSQAYKDEVAMINFTPTGEELNKFKAGFAKDHDGRQPNRKEVMEYIIQTSQDRKDMFRQEAMADKVGLRLTKDIYAAQVAQLKMAEDAGNLNQQALDHPHETANSQNRGVSDPHPSVNVRWQENLETLNDMKAESGPSGRNPPPKGPAGNKRT